MSATRIWIGPEREGFDQGVMTLFYEDKTPDCMDIIQYLESHPEIKRVYLGAGRKYPTCITNANVLSDYAWINKVSVVIEVLLPISISIPPGWTIIGVCTERPTFLKTDDGKTVNVYKLENPATTDLKDLSDGLFSCDTIIKE